jgi:hypothetical protein
VISFTFTYSTAALIEMLIPSMPRNQRGEFGHGRMRLRPISVMLPLISELQKMQISRPLCLLLVLSSTSAAWAQRAERASDAAYPTRHIRLIAPFTAGSTLDIMARLVADRLTTGLKENVIVDNRPGANGIVGIDLVRRPRRTVTPC